MRLALDSVVFINYECEDVNYNDLYKFFKENDCMIGHLTKSQEASESTPATIVKRSPIVMLNPALPTLEAFKSFSFLNPAHPQTITPSIDKIIPKRTMPPPGLVKKSSRPPNIINGKMVPKTAEIPIASV